MNQSEREKAMTLLAHQPAFIYRLRFSRSGSLSFIGHLDLMRTFERSLRRAGFPLLHSQGYNPRPMLVFALPLGVGISTTDDYVDVSLAEARDIMEVMAGLQNALPDGLRILDGWPVPETGGSIMAMVTAARYRLQAQQIFPALQRLFLRGEVTVEKRSKGQLRMLDIRPLMLALEHGEIENENEAIVLVCAGSHENLRPDLLLQALTAFEDFPLQDAANCGVERSGLYAGTYPDLKCFKEMI